jgi:hypothetical protein
MNAAAESGSGQFLEPAYPLAFTLGAAEYAAITSADPLGGALSLTGAAW